MSKRKDDDKKKNNGTRNALIALGVILLSMVICTSVTLSSGIWLVNRSIDQPMSERTTSQRPTWSPDSAELTVAVSPVMAPVLDQLADEFNRQAGQASDGQTMTVAVVPYEPEKMVSAALGEPEFQALSPDSTLWLDQLEQAWAVQSQAGADKDSEDGSSTSESDDTVIPMGQSRVSEQVRYAVSPIVIAAWADVAETLGWPQEPVGWQEIQRLAAENPDFKWSHPSTNNAAGLLATLAEFYAGSGLTRGLTTEAATAPETLEYVKAVESSIRFYGEGEEVIVERLANEGRNFLDAFVAQERTVIDWNRRYPDNKLVAIYPAEGTLWTDHPLALLELGEADGQNDDNAVTANQRQTFQAFADFLTDPATQQKLLTAGYRPADLSIPLDGTTSPFAGTTTVNWREPQTTLQMPSPAVIDVVRNVWYYAKKPTNVYLVVNTSGSMGGSELRSTQEALTAFVDQIQGDKDAVGLVEFGSGVKNFRPVRTLNEQARDDLHTLIDNMEASGSTAMLDAAYSAALDLQSQADAGAINALVIMTDGQENASRRSLVNMQRLLQNPEAPPLVIFTIAFGDRADEEMMRMIAEIGGGQFRYADETDVEELYKVISTYF